MQVGLLVLSMLVLASLASIPVAGAGGNLSVSVNVQTSTKSVNINPTTATYTNCLYAGNATTMGFPNGACEGSTGIQITNNGQVPAQIFVAGADMVPSDNGTHWTLCIFNSDCTGSGGLPGTNQYYETVSNAAGVNTGMSKGTGSFQGLKTSANCDTILSPATCPALGVGAGGTDFIAATGPSTSSDSSSSFATSITWTAN